MVTGGGMLRACARSTGLPTARVASYELLLGEPGTLLDTSTCVLVVDDDAGFRRPAGRVLTGMGILVVGDAATIAGALAPATELQPDAALVDMGLPVGDGSPSHRGSPRCRGVPASCSSPRMPTRSALRRRAGWAPRASCRSPSWRVRRCAGC
jgi:hypothetical protein